MPRPIVHLYTLTDQLMHTSASSAWVLIGLLASQSTLVSAVQVDSACAIALHSTQTLVHDSRNTLAEFMRSKENQALKTRLTVAIKTYSGTELSILELLEADEVSTRQKAEWVKGSKEVSAAGKTLTAAIKPDGPQSSDLVEDMSIAEMGLKEVALKCMAQVA